MIEISAAISAVNATVGLVKGAIDARDDAKAREALFEMQSKLSDMFAAHFALIDRHSALIQRVHELDGQLRELQEKLVLSSAYRLARLPSGQFAVVSNEDRGQPEHYLCQTCFDSGKKSVLQTNVYDENLMQCLSCKVAIAINPVHSPG
jgi:hypothetical protein